MEYRSSPFTEVSKNDDHIGVIERNSIEEKDTFRGQYASLRDGQVAEVFTIMTVVEPGEKVDIFSFGKVKRLIKRRFLIQKMSNDNFKMLNHPNQALMGYSIMVRHVRDGFFTSMVVRRPALKGWGIYLSLKVKDFLFSFFREKRKEFNLVDEDGHRYI